jgi:peptidyl-prolyl cis-trans isomerase SurA
MINRQNRRNQFCYGLVLTLALVLFPGVTAAQDGDEESEPRILDEIVAKVNSEIITLTDLNKALDRLNSSLMNEFPDPQARTEAFEERKKTILMDMVYNTIMLQKAEELGVSSDIEVDVAAFIEERRKEAGIPSLDVLDQYLKQQGSSLSEYRERIKEQMISQSLIQQFVYSKITLLTPEIEAYYKSHQDDFRTPAEVELAEILFLTEGKEKSEVRDRAEKALTELKNGEPFGQVAQKYSEGPTADQGGVIGTFNEGSLNERLEKVVFSIDVGSFSDIIENDYGFQIVKVLNRESASVKPMQEVRPQIADALYQKKAQPEMKEFLESLVEESYIYIAPKYAEEFDVEGLI